MHSFGSVRAAKVFLVEKIVEEARRESVALSEIEERMLYFTETGWTLPDVWEVNKAFDREYDQAEYEEKIVGLIQGFQAHAHQSTSVELEAWNEAVKLLRKEDHYLLVMIDIASSGRGRLLGESVSSDFASFAVRTVLISIAAGVGLVALLIIYAHFRS